MHNIENEKKCTPQKMTEKLKLENDSMENVQPGNGRKFTYCQLTEKAHPENERMENAQNGKSQKMYTLENNCKVTTRK